MRTLLGLSCQTSSRPAAPDRPVQAGIPLRFAFPTTPHVLWREGILCLDYSTGERREMLAAGTPARRCRSSTRARGRGPCSETSVSRGSQWSPIRQPATAGAGRSEPRPSALPGTVWVKRSAGHRHAPAAVDGAVWRDPERVDEWIGELSKDEPVVTFCVYGFHIGCQTATALRKAGFDARYTS